jgi:hypothetical protein
MIEGVVSESLEAVVVVEVSGPAGKVLQIPAVIDTGFTGDLMLSKSAIRTLELPTAGTRMGTLADGQVMNFTVYPGARFMASRKSGGGCAGVPLQLVIGHGTAGRFTALDGRDR